MSDQIDLTREEKVLKAKQLYSQGSRNYLVKSYDEAADQLSEVCSIYEDVYGELSDILGMPYLLYAKSLIALALDENKVIDVSEEEDDCETDTTEHEQNEQGQSIMISKYEVGKTCTIVEKNNQVSKTETCSDVSNSKAVEKDIFLDATDVNTTLKQDEPATSSNTAEIDENDSTSNLQLAWEILELAAKIFSRQGMNGLLNLAEVLTELANIEFENNVMDSAREDYKKALNIYNQLSDNHRRAMAEIYYKIGLSYVMQQSHHEAIEEFKMACSLIDNEITEIKAKEILNDKEKELVQDMEETKQEIWLKIEEIEDIRKQNVRKVGAVLDNAINNTQEHNSKKNCTSTSHPLSAKSSRPVDISHLIKRKRADPESSDAESAELQAKKKAH